MIVLQFIKKYNKEISIDWVVEESYKGLLEYHPDVNKVHAVNLKEVKKRMSLSLLFKELKRLHSIGTYDLVVDMQGLIKSAIISRIIKSDITLGFDRFSSRERLSTFFYNKTFNISYDKNVIQRNLELLNFVIDYPLSKKLIEDKVPFLYTAQNFIFKELSGIKKNILIIPGASNLSKRYSSLKLAELTLLLDANILVVWGNLEEKNLANEIKSLSRNVNVCSALSLNSLISLVSKVDLVIGPDTGPTHMAWALNIPSITLFGSTPGYRNTFITNINQYLESSSKVNPNKIDLTDNSIDEIKVSEILKLSERLLRL